MNETPSPGEPQRKPPPGPPGLPEDRTRQERGNDDTESNMSLKGCGALVVAAVVVVLLFLGVCGFLPR